MAAAWPSVEVVSLVPSPDRPGPVRRGRVRARVWGANFGTLAWLELVNGTSVGMQQKRRTGSWPARPVVMHRGWRHNRESMADLGERRLSMVPRRSLFWCVLVAVAAGRLATADDTVITKGGKRIRGSIVSESRAEVVIRTRGGATERYAVDEIDRIQYDGPAGTALAQALFSERAGKLEQALKRYEEVIAQASAGSLPQIAARFGRARIRAKLALLDPEQAASARKALESFLERYSGSRHYYPALELLARVALASGDRAAARRTLQQLAEAPVAVYRTVARLELAKLRVAEGQAQEAEQLVRQVLQEQLPQQAQWRARLALGEVLAAQGKFEEAEKEIRGVIDAVPAEEATLNVEAFLALGRMYERAKKPIDAILAYLYVDLNYPNAGPLRAEALARLAELWEQVGRPDRARQARETLAQDYPNSRWARAASANAP